MPRIPVPTVSNTKAATSVLSIPKWRTHNGAMGANNPRQSMGRVVRYPAVEREMPVDCTISGRTTDKLGKINRRLNASSIKALAASQGEGVRSVMGVSLLVVVFISVSVYENNTL